MNSEKLFGILIMGISGVTLILVLAVIISLNLKEPDNTPRVERVKGHEFWVVHDHWMHSPECKKCYVMFD